MIVQLCYRTKDMPEGQVRIFKTMLMREARYVFENQIKNNPLLERAYIRYFNGYHYRIKANLFP